MENLAIRRVILADIDQLQEIGRRTFFETFSNNNSAENMNAYLDSGFSTEKLQSELIDDRSEFYFAILENEIIGYLKINFEKEQSKVKNQNSLEIERIYVLKEFHGKKIGQILYDQAVTIAIEKNFNYIWLGVWEENPRAIRFYKKNGFVEFDKHIFKLGNDEQTDILMKLDLNNNPR